VVSAKVKGKTQGLPCAGPPTVVHDPAGAAVVVVVVVVVVLVVPDEHSLVVQVGCPWLLQMQVLQSTAKSSPGVQVLEQSSTPLLQAQVLRPETNVSPESASEQVVVLASAPGQDEGQNP